jgi:iron complex transport system ATP-binding protein
MILLIDACLTSAAMVHAIITATEVKTQVLMAHGIRTPEGYAATGTSTDAMAVACTDSGTSLLYAGPVTLVGWLIGRCVRMALGAAMAQG